MIAGMAALVGAVQTNCDIADARHARDVSLCTYLLGMREFYRWEHQLPYGVSPPREEVGRWIAASARRAGRHRRPRFRQPAGGRTRTRSLRCGWVNAALAGSGLVYGAGIGRFRKPHFFLGELDREERRGDGPPAGLRLRICARRGGDSGGLAGRTLIVRREALRQWLWEKAEGWNVKQQDGALKSALLAYGYDLDPQAAIERMTRARSKPWCCTRRASFAAGRLLGGAWADKLAGLWRQARRDFRPRGQGQSGRLPGDAAALLARGRRWSHAALLVCHLRRSAPRDVSALLDAYGAKVGAGDTAILAAAPRPDRRISRPRWPGAC
jgi:hypothetical protein